MYHYQLGISTTEHDEFVIQSNQTNLLQSSSWAKIKDNWGNERVGFYQEDQLVAVASILIQPLPLGFFHALYSSRPHYGLPKQRAGFICDPVP